MKKVYRINCEWDTDLTDMLFDSKEKAMKELEAYDWENLVEDNLENLMKDGYITIEEVKLR